MTIKLTTGMQRLLNDARAHGDKLVRLPDGFWTWDGWVENRTDAQLYHAATVAALVYRGLVEHTDWYGNLPIKAKVKQVSGASPSEAPRGVSSLDSGGGTRLPPVLSEEG